MKIEKYSDYSNQEINEAFWQDVKYGLSKLGRYKAGGKILGKGKVTKKAQSEVEDILQKETNKVLKNLHDNVNSLAPGYPNNKSKRRFLEGIIMYGKFYDSIVAAGKKDPKEEGYLSPEVCNEIIKDLRTIVKKHLDVDLKAAYSVMESEDIQFSDLDSLNEEEEFIKKLGQLKDKAMDKLFGAKKGTDAPKKSGTGQSAKLQQTSGETNIQSDRMSTLQSNRLPLILAGVGGTLGALGWLAQTEWMKNFIIEWFGPDKMVTDTKEIVKNIDGGKPDSKGLVHWMSQINQAEGAGPIKTAGDVTDFINKFGGVDGMSGFFVGNGGGDPLGQAQLLQQVCSGNPTTGVWEIFTKAAGMAGTMKGGQNLFGISNQANFVGKTIKTEVTKTLVKGTGGAIAAKVAGIGKLLSGIGIALVATGVVVKLMREKGQRQSRAKTLNDLLQSLQFVKVGEPTKQEDKTDTIKSVEISEKSLYPIMIKNLTALRGILLNQDNVKIEGETGTKKDIVAGKYKSREISAKKDKLQPVGESVLSISEILLEKDRLGKGANIEVTSQEAYLTQAVQNTRKSLKSLQDEKDKGVSITVKFINDILEKKMETSTKEPVKNLYKDIYEYLYGSKSKTLSELGSLYKESVDVISKSSSRQVVAEKMARFSKRTMQFEGEGFYSGLGKFGDYIEDYNSTLKQIMDYYKSQKNEKYVFNFSEYKKNPEI